MTIDLSIVDWRSPDARKRALALGKAQRAAMQHSPSFDDDAVLEVLQAAIDKAVAEMRVPDDWRIDAQVQYHDDPTGSDQFNIWFRFIPSPPVSSAIPPEGLTEHVPYEPVEETPPPGG